MIINNFLEKGIILKAGVLILAFVVYLLLESVYVDVVSSIFENNRIYVQLNIPRYLAGKAMLLFVLGMAWTAKKNHFIFSFGLIFNLFFFVPNLIIFEYTNVNPLIAISIFIFQIIFFFSAQVKFPIFKAFTLNQDARDFLLIGISVIIFIPLLLHYGFTLNWRVFLLEDIYDVRAESIEKANPMMGYFSSWLTKVFVPIGLLHSLSTKKYYLTSIYVGILTYMFLAEAHKTVYFSAIFLLFFSLIKNWYKQTFLVITGILTLLVIGRLVSISTENYLMEGIFFIRTFLTPAELNIIYFEFFNAKPLYYSHSIFSFIFDYPYTIKDPAYLIGYNYYNNIDHGANNGIFSDGFMNFGLAGVFLNFGVVISVFRYFSSLNISSRYYGVFLIVASNLISSPLITNLFTHGLLLLILISAFVLRNTSLNEA